MILYNILYPCLDEYGFPYVQNSKVKDYAILARVEDRLQVSSEIDVICLRFHKSSFFQYNQGQGVAPAVRDWFDVEPRSYKHSKPFRFDPMSKMFTCQDNGDHGTAYCTVCKSIFPWDVTIEEGLDWDETKKSLVLVCPNKHFDRD